MTYQNQSPLFRVLMTFAALGALATSTVGQSTDETTKPQAGQSQDAQVGQPNIEVTPDIFDFGTIWQGVEATKEFTVKNTGDAPLAFTLKASCGCTTLTEPKSPLAPGEATTFKVTYDTKRFGKARKRVTITSNDPDMDKIVLFVQGEVKPLYQGSPEDFIKFDEAKVNTEATQSIILENQHPDPVKLMLKQDQKAPFRIELRELEPGRKYELRATTEPPLKRGWNRRMVWLETDLKEVPRLMYAVSANVTPSVFVTPATLYVLPPVAERTDYPVWVHFRAKDAIEIERVESNNKLVEATLVGLDAKRRGLKIKRYELRVSCPPYAEMPEEPVVVDIYTNSADPDYQHLELKVARREVKRLEPNVRHEAQGDAKSNK